MPRKINYIHPMYGNGIVDTLGNALGFVKQNKLISRGLTTAAPAAGEYAPLVGAAGAIAGLLGFGRPRRARRRPAKKGGGKRKVVRKRKPKRY